MSSSADSTRTWKFQEVYEAAKGQDLPTLAYAGLIDEKYLDHLLSFKQTYEQSHPDEPANPEKHPKYQDIVERQITKNLRSAVKNGNLSEVAYAVGLPDDSQGYAPIREYETLRKLFLSEQVNTFLYAGPMGGGKSADMGKNSEFIMRIADVEGLDIIPLTNIKSITEYNDEYIYVKNMLDVMDALVEHDADHYLLMLDEMSSFLTGYGKHLDKSANFGTFNRRGRKLGLKQFYVGHRVTDITPNIREQPGTRLIYKPEQERTLVFDGVVEDPEDNISESEVDLQGQTDTRLEGFNTEGLIPWSFKGLDLWKEIIEERGVETIAEFKEVYPKAKEEWLEEEDTGEDEYHGMQCLGRNKDGSRCSVEHGRSGHLYAYGVCQGRHKDQHEVVANEGTAPYKYDDEEWEEVKSKYDLD